WNLFDGFARENTLREADARRGTAAADLAASELRAVREVWKAYSDVKTAIAKHEFYKRVLALLDQGRPARALQTEGDERLWMRELQLITSKPALYIANVDEPALRNGNAYLAAVEAYAKAENAVVVPVCAAIEAEIAQLDEADKLDFLRDLGLEEPGLNRVIRGAYSLLGLQTYFTAGVQEVRAWTVKAGSTGPQAAGVIHTDFERGFIRAEVIGYDDYIRYRGEPGAKDAGKWRLEGKEYIVREGDVMHFRFNV
ncbi:MAG: DUF933 domain-containing protein, partial [Panacagrimonas sp.]